MKVDHDEIGIAAELVADQRAIHRREHRIIITHEKVGDGVDHNKALTLVIRHRDGAVAGRALGHVERAKKARRRLDVRDDLTLVPDVVACCQNIDSAGEQLITDGRRHAETAG